MKNLQLVEDLARRKSSKHLLAMAERAIHTLFMRAAKGNARRHLLAVEKWERDVLRVMDAIPFISEYERSMFRVITPYTREPFVGKTPAHTKIRTELIERVERLRVICARLERLR